VTPSGRLDVRTALPGSFNVLNAAAAAACGLALDFEIPAIAAGIEGLALVPGRLESIAAGQPFTVFVDYAHTEESLAAVLDAVRGHELFSGLDVVPDLAFQRHLVGGLTSGGVKG